MARRLQYRVSAVSLALLRSSVRLTPGFASSRRQLDAKRSYASEQHFRLRKVGGSGGSWSGQGPWFHDLVDRSFSRRRDLTRQEVETHRVHDSQATTRWAGQRLLHDIDIPPVCRWSCRLGNHCSASSGQPTWKPTFGYHPHPDSGAQPQVGLELIPTSTMQSA
jgi:hypothetical protein